MAGGYAYQPEGVEGLRAAIVSLQNQIDALRRAQTGLGLQVDPSGNLIFDGSRGDLDITNGGNLNLDGSETVKGTLYVIDTLGNIVGQLGQFADGTYGAGFWRKDGTVGMQVTETFVGIWDKAGNIVVSDDATTGNGLATPYLGGGLIMVPGDVSYRPKTQSASFIDITSGYYRVQNPKAQWDIEAVADSGTAGQYLLMVNGTQVGATQAVGTAFTTWTQYNTALPASATIGSIATVTIQARRTSGTGNVYVAMKRWSGDQS